MPQQLGVPAGPISPAYRPFIMVRSNGSASIKLSEAAVNVEGASVEIKELAAGKIFQLTLAFPTTFQVSTAAPAQLTFKTDHPKFPLIRVPIIQLLPPAVAPPAPATKPTVAPTASK